MASETISDVRHVVHISTGIGTGCKHCHHSIGLERFAESINHYIEAHGYRLLHVGQQTEGYSENPYQTTVAVVGTTLSADELPSRPQVKVTMG
jgi:hypothetical protein